MPKPDAWYDDSNELIHVVKQSGWSGAPLPRIEGYDGLTEIARGGQGVVYRATQVSTKRMVAIKVLREGAFASQAERRRFEREIELVAALRHPNIVRVYDSGVTSDGRLFLVMEFVEGRPLHESTGDSSVATDVAPPKPATGESGGTTSAEPR